jgi:hypothetical protein
MTRMKPLFLDTKDVSLSEMEAWGRDLIGDYVI